jgi:hypothetical protein
MIRDSTYPQLVCREAWFPGHLVNNIAFPKTHPKDEDETVYPTSIAQKQTNKIKLYRGTMDGIVHVGDPLYHTTHTPTHTFFHLLYSLDYIAV